MPQQAGVSPSLRGAPRSFSQLEICSWLGTHPPEGGSWSSAAGKPPQIFSGPPPAPALRRLRSAPWRLRTGTRRRTGSAGLAAGQGRRVQGSGVHGSGVQGAWQQGAGQRGAVPHPAQPPAPSPSPSPAPLSCTAGTPSWCGQKTKQNQLLLQCFPRKAGTSEPVGS